MFVIVVVVLHRLSIVCPLDPVHKNTTVGAGCIRIYTDYTVYVADVLYGKRVPIILPIDSYVKFTDFKNSHYFTIIPDPGKGLPSFESLIQALSKYHMKMVG